MADLLLGPLLRHVGETTATVWVETDAPCEVEVLGRSAPTFHVAGHHYALVALDGLEPGSAHAYGVRLDGESRWPEEGSRFPESVLRTLGPGPLELVFGSCRVAAPHEPPHTDRYGIDALAALAERMRGEPPARRPDILLMLGDQVYADAVSPGTRDFIRSRRPVTRPPHEEVADFEEYTHLYREAWSEPSVRWLLANLPSAMIFDDHDIHDDWNISASWRAEMAAQPWWHERVASGLAAYWIYQHLGNLSPAALEADDLYRRVRQVGDGAPLLREHAGGTSRWSYSWELPGARLVVIDSRAGRVVTASERELIGEEEWRFVEGEARGEVDHLLLATSLPFLLPPAMHELEAWNEAVCAGAWGPLAARLGERLRRRLDVDHWAGFRSSFLRLAELIRAVAAGERGRAPASVVVLSGDVHYTYLAGARLGGGPHAPVYQAVCSPLRNSLPAVERAAARVAVGARAARLARALARSAGVPPPPLEWRLDAGPWFDNALSALALDGRTATLRVGKATLAGARPSLEPVHERRLTV